LARTIPLAALLLWLTPFTAAADVVLDGSFGLEGSVPAGTGPDGIFTDHLILEDFGRRAGQNLFFSFEGFSIPAEQSATFTADNPTNNVLARVTGGSMSTIDGALRSTIEGADLFLLNPSGVIFGQDSSLDLKGSLYLSTADVLVFSDGFVWPTGEPTSGLLSAAEPSSFGFLGADPATIEFDAARLEVPAGSTLSAVGGDLRVAGRRNSTIPALRATGGTVQLASVAGPADVPVDASSWDIDSLEPEALGEIDFTDRATVDVSGSGSRGSGRVVIRGGSFRMEWGEIRALTDAVDGAATGVDIDVAGDLEVDGRARITAGTGGDGDSGDIELRGEKITVTDRSVVSIGTDGAGTGGGIQLEADEVLVTGSAQVLTGALSTGDAGAIDVKARALEVSDRASIATLSVASGAAGQLTLDVDSVTLSDRGQLAVESSSSGAGGGIEVKHADTLTLTSDASISSLSQQDGGGSAIRVVDSGTVRVTDGGRIASENRGSMTGGKIEIAAQGLEVTDGGQVTSQATAEATGRGGDVEVHAQSVLVSTGADSPVISQIGALTSSQNEAAGGNLSLRVDTVEVRDGGQLRTTTEGTGRAGDLFVRATDAVLASGAISVMEEGVEVLVPSGIFARSQEGATGNGGQLVIEATSVDIENGAEVSARTRGEGDAGALVIRSAERVSVSGGSNGRSVISAVGAEGNGGDLSIATRDLALTSGGQITVSASKKGDSGDVTIDARTVLISGEDPRFANPSAIFAQTNARPGEVEEGGNAGDINLLASDSLRVLDGAEISAESRGVGTSGSITLRSSGVIEFARGGAVSARAESSGSAGSITLRGAEKVTLSSGAAVTAETTGRGQAGSISFEDVAQIELSDAAITTQTEAVTEDPARTGGAITIAGGDTLILVDGALITSQTSGTDDGGQIAISTVTGVGLASGSTISSESTGSGDAGDISIDAGLVFESRNSFVTTQADIAFGGSISITAKDLIYPLNSEITTRVQAGVGDGGNITLDPRFVVINGSQIIASAIGGNGGNITITGNDVLISGDTTVDASSQLGISGTIAISSPDTSLIAGLVRLPETFLDASSQLERSCSARTARAGSLVVRGRDRIPASPDAPLRGFYMGGGQPSSPATVN